ncbi:MAG TPA: response regulator [Chitinophagaceae bacterium]|nr:response regulator [Chitinophagaceae bacterium]
MERVIMVRKIPYLNSSNIAYKTVPLKKSMGANQPLSQNSKFILLGEDDVDDEEILKEVFSSIDDSFMIEFMNNGKKLVEALDEREEHFLPCLIILDYNMPGLNGAEILRELKSRERYREIPVIIWSTSGSETYKRHCLQAGACDYIIKPSNISGLAEALRYMLSFCTIQKS